jgi:hypothetical protein
MDKAVKIPLIALSILTTQLVVLLGDTTMSKSAQYKPNENVNTKIIYKQISQTYYDRQIKIESMPVMYEQKNKQNLIAQPNSNLRNELNNINESLERRDRCEKKFESQSSFRTSWGSLVRRVVGNDIYEVSSDTSDICSEKWTKVDVIGVQRMYSTSDLRNERGYPQRIYYKENGKLCIYDKYDETYDVRKECYEYKQY